MSGQAVLLDGDPDIQHNSKQHVSDDAIISHLSYGQHYWDQRVIHFNQDDHHDVMRSIQTAQHHAQNDLGQLDCLPDELLQMIYLKMDIKTIFRFRHVNRRAKEQISTLRQYSIIVKHSLDCFCALLRTNTASSIELTYYYKLLCQSKCSHCKTSTGNMIHLPTWTRVCRACARPVSSPANLALTMMSVSRAKTTANVRAKDLRNMTILQTIDGTFRGRGLQSPRMQLVSLKEVSRVYQDTHNGLHLAPAMIIKSADLSINCYYHHMSSCTMPMYDAATNSSQRTLYCLGCCKAYAIPGIPQPARWIRDDNGFTREEFLRHYQTCVFAQAIWQMSRQGRIELPRPLKNVIARARATGQ